MTRSSIAMVLFGAALGTACGDDSSGDGTTSTSGSTSTTRGESDTMTPDTTTEPGTTTNETTTGVDTTDTDVVDTGDSGSTGTGTDTAGVDCDAIAPGPLAAEMVFAAGAVFAGSEDIAFDGQGNMAGKSGDQILLVDPMGNEVDSWPDLGGTYGLRYRSTGDLLAAKFELGEIRRVVDGSAVASGLGGVNGLYPDFDGNVWFTNFSTVRRLNPDDSVDDIVTGGDSVAANGVILDPDRGLLFYTNYGAGQLRSVEIMGDGSPGAVSMVAAIPGAALDGLSLDACGNIYMVDQANSRLYRVFLDEAGAAIGDPEQLIASFPTNVANAIFGSGDGWDEMSLYAAGIPGGVYRVEIGVPGAPAPMP